jgi:hypothetical protein
LKQLQSIAKKKSLKKFNKKKFKLTLTYEEIKTICLVAKQIKIATLIIDSSATLTIIKDEYFFANLKKYIKNKNIIQPSSEKLKIKKTRKLKIENLPTKIKALFVFDLKYNFLFVF